MADLDVYALVQSAHIAHALYVLTKRRVFDSLMRPSTIAELTMRCGLQELPLAELLGLAVSAGLVQKEGDVHSIVERGYPLTRFSRSWVRSYLLLWGEQLSPAFEKLDDWATTLSNPFEQAHGAKIWDFYRQDAKANERFVEYMDLVSDQGHIPVIVRSLAVGAAKHVVDVGGGKGALLCDLLTRHTHLHGTLFDEQHMQEAANHRIEATAVKKYLHRSGSEG